jgi:hypothetical protein
LTHNTYAADIVRQTRSGWTIHPEDVEAISGTIERVVLDDSFYQSLEPDAGAVAQFTWTRHAEVLSDLFTTLTS